ncbi:MAG TPA: glycosyltransferase [Patescibacteria group bacterium]|nr:glycosyltransferase [Patescibacteria group bacterium]
MRVGDIVLTCVTHLPDFKGYHAKRFEVVQKCLTSMRDNAGGAYTVIIWDNGSCEDFRAWVENEYKPDIFIRSGNVGKSVARAALFGMLEPDTIVNYSDDDIYHYPNWLMPQIELLKHFPDVSCVTGYPVRTQFLRGVENTIKRLKTIYGRFIPQEWEDDYAVSVQMNKDDHTAFVVNTKDIMVEYNGMKAFGTSHHCQHIGRAGLLAAVARSVMMYGSIPTESPYDIALDKMGNRLATLHRYTRHMGNVIDDNLRRDILKAEKVTK